MSPRTTRGFLARLGTLLALANAGACSDRGVTDTTIQPGVPAHAVRPTIIADLEIEPDTIHPGETATATFTLDTPAPAGGAEVTFTYDNPLLTLPASASIPVGERSTTIEIVADPAPRRSYTHIQATSDSSVAWSGITVISEAEEREVESLVVDRPTLVGGSDLRGRVTLSNWSGPDIVVSLESSHPVIVRPPDSVVVPQGSDGLTFPIATFDVTDTTTVTLVARTPGGEASAHVEVRPGESPRLSGVVVTPDSVRGSGTLTGRFSLTQSIASGAVVRLTSSYGSWVRLPLSVIISPGAAFADFEAQVSAWPQSTTTVTITATGLFPADLGEVSGTLTLLGP